MRASAAWHALALPGSAPLHRLECHGAATAGGCALRQLCGKEITWPWPLLELTWEEQAGHRAAVEHGLGVEQVDSDCRASEAKD